MSMENEHEPSETPALQGHVVQAKRRYRRAADEERELDELIKARELEQQGGEAAEPDDDTEGLDAEEATFKKRYGDLRRHSQKLQEEHKKEIAKLQEQISAATSKELKMPKTQEELEEWSKKYPDVAEMVETIAMKKSRESAEGIEKQLEQLQEMRREVVRAKAEQELKELHPDYDKIRQDPEFHEWASVQPRMIQEALYDNQDDALAAGKAITLYKAEMKGRKRSPARAEAAESVSPKSKTRADDQAGQRITFSESLVRKMTAREYEKYEADIEKAIQNGTFEYDISGAAR